MALVGDDCFFFLNSGCVRGSQCTFRHQPAARNTTIVCPQWLQRCCFKPTCVFRHTDDIVTRNQTPCYYESSSGVCWKPRCAFAHVRKPSVPVPLPPPPPVLPLRPPVLPAMPPVLPAMPPILPASVGISAVPHPAPLAANIPLPNNSPVVRAEAPVMVEKPVTNVNTSALPQAVVAPLTTPPPGLPSPPKLTEMLLGTKLPPTVKEAVASPAEKQPHSTASAPPTQNVQSGVAPAAVVRKPVAAAAFPKSDHFNEQVRRFKEMLAAKSTQSQKKLKNDYSDDEKGSYKVKERQRSKKERREKDGYKSYKSSKTTKEKWSKADEEILYGDYKDVPLDRKHKKKKHKEHKEYADSEPEVQVKSYEEILREKALRKLYSRRKEKFNEDFKELVDEKAARKDTVSDKTDRINDGLPDKVIRKNKRYNSDGGEVESSDDSEPDHVEYRRRYSKSEDFEKSKDAKKPEGNHINISDQEDSDYHPKNNDIHDSMLKKALIDSEIRQRKRSKKHSKKRKHKEKRNEIDDDVDLIEIHSNGDSKKEAKKKSETSGNKEVSRRSSDSGSEDTESDSDSESGDDKAPSKREEIIIPDETANIDFSVDFDDDLAMEINQTEQSETVSKSKKLISSVVVPINSNAPEKNKQKKMIDRVASDTKSSNPRHHKADSRSSGRGYSNKQSESKRSSEKDLRRKSPNDSSNNRVLQTEHKKVVRLINTTEQPLSEDRASPTISSSNDTNLVETRSTVKNIKVKSFDEIMAEKHKRNTKNTINLVSERFDVVSADSPVIAKTINATLKEKSTRAKLEILNVSKEENGHSTSIGGDKSPSRSKILTDEEKQKRKSIQLYKPPHPTKIEGSSAKNTEVKMVVNTGPRKIIRIRKASLSTDLIDQNPPAENVEIASSVNERNDVRETVNVRSFEEIIREKRARQRRERELAQQLEKENSSSDTVTTVTNNLIRRKPVIRRQVLPSTTSVIASTSSLSKSITTVTTILSTTTTTSNTNTYSLLNVNETRRTTHSDSNVAKVSPLNVVPPKRIKSDSSVTPAVTQAESLENRDFFSRLRNTASRRTSTASSHSSVKESERTHQGKHRKRSVTSTQETSPVSTNHLQNEHIKFSIDNSTLPSDASHETKVEHHGPSRKDIQEALDEKRRKREQDLLSDDEFEKEINELGSDDGDENFDDMDEDDLMMELEQMIDS